MASKTYIQHYVDGTSEIVKRSAKQGRKIGTGEGVQPRSYSSSEKDETAIIENAKKLGMSKSAYICLAAVMYEPKQLS